MEYVRYHIIVTPVEYFETNGYQADWTPSEVFDAFEHDLNIQGDEVVEGDLELSGIEGKSVKDLYDMISEHDRFVYHQGFAEFMARYYNPECEIIFPEA